MKSGGVDSPCTSVGERVNLWVQSDCKPEYPCFTEVQESIVESFVLVFSNDNLKTLTICHST